MTTFWLIILAVAVVLFFGAALVIIVAGIRDLRDLITGCRRKD